VAGAVVAAVMLGAAAIWAAVDLEAAGLAAVDLQAATLLAGWVAALHPTQWAELPAALRRM
jgi:hypothetical protein